MSKYYYLIAGLPEITLEDSKLSYSVSDFKTQIYPELSDEDKKLIDLFYLKFDNKNVLLLLKDKDAEIDPRGKYSVEELTEYIATIKEGGEIPADVFPTYLSRFMTEYFSDKPKEEGVLPEDHLSTLYYDYAMHTDNRFVAAWFGFNLNINNILVALTARKYKLDIASSIVGNTEITEALRNSNARDFGLSAEVDYLDQVLKIGETPELVDRERQLDLLRWNWLEEETFFNYFTIERIFAFLLKLEMIERWLSLDTEKGNQLFRGIIDSLKNEVQIPPEFR
ncbi:MAG: DUF2764 domain-containing protein [Bacteroides sp.]|nr:DUF2764 domain-containing protein [Bacteroides sp.]